PPLRGASQAGRPWLLPPGLLLLPGRSSRGSHGVLRRFPSPALHPPGSLSLQACSRPAPGLLQSGSRGSPRAPALLLAPLLGWPLFHVKHVQLCVWAAASFREIGCPSPAPVAENALEAARDTDGQSPRPAVAENAPDACPWRDARRFPSASRCPPPRQEAPLA